MPVPLARARRAATLLVLICLALLAPPFVSSFGAARAQEADPAVASHAVVFIYHRFGENGLPSTSIRLDQFDDQLRELRDGGYNVLPLADIVKALQAGETLADKTVGISIDDAYLSVYANAWPRLKAAGFPFTVFVSTEPVDRQAPGFMTWDQLREMAQSRLATIGGHSVTHLHMPLADPARNAEELARSAARIAAEIGAPPTLFAYPYGEMSLAVKQQVKTAGYAAAFGQQSGVLHAGEDFFYLPRFSLNEHFGDMTRFRMAARALALPVDDVTPADPYIAGENPPAFGFTLLRDVGNLDRLACYYAAQTLKIERLGARRIEVRIPKAFPPGRARINCTLPAAGGRWRWYGMQFLAPYPPGQSPAD